MRIAALAGSALLLAGAAEACTRVNLHQHFDVEAMHRGNSGRRWRMWLWDNDDPRVEMDTADIFDRVGAVANGGSRFGTPKEGGDAYHVHLESTGLDGVMKGTINYPKWNSKPRAQLVIP